MQQRRTLRIPDGLADVCDPERIALIVYDMQVGVVRHASEAIFDKLSMSAFEGTPLAVALRDSQVTGFVIAGVATEVGLEPTVRNGADRGLIPIVVTDA